MRAVVYNRYATTVNQLRHRDTRGEPPERSGHLPETGRDWKVRPVIDRRYRLEDVIDATRYVETEQKVGNVVLTV
jgi:NADPH:quinone reductase-like Zn-dependent oxidoreductase